MNCIKKQKKIWITSSLSELTQILFDMELSHLGTKAFICETYKKKNRVIFSTILLSSDNTNIIPLSYLRIDGDIYEFYRCIMLFYLNTSNLFIFVKDMMLKFLYNFLDFYIFLLLYQAILEISFTNDLYTKQSYCKIVFFRQGVDQC